MEIDDWINAGKITEQALNYGLGKLKIGSSMRELLEDVENFIINKADFAFPPQISVNEIAAHFTPCLEDYIFKEGDVVKLDFGVSVNGAIGDAARTKCLKCNSDEFDLELKLIETAKQCVYNVIDYFKKMNINKYYDKKKNNDKSISINKEQINSTISLSKISNIIYKTAQQNNLNTIVNLTGHGLNRYIIHDKPSIPNYPVEKGFITKESFFAIEPFITKGAGKVIEKGEPTIFMLYNFKKPRDFIAKKIFDIIKIKFPRFPFSLSWILKEAKKLNINLNQVRYGLRILSNSRILIAFPPLVEISKEKVAQYENSFYFGNEIKVLTESFD